MEITEVRIKLMENSEDRLRGFCSITIDDMFVVRDLKIIDGNNGPFVAMPSRKLSSNCQKCRSKNHIRARFCNNCGARQRQESIEFDNDGRPKLYADIAHPINADCREMIQRCVIEELENELQRAAQPGYYSNYDDDYVPRMRRSSEHDVKEIKDIAEDDDTTFKHRERVDRSQQVQSGPHTESSDSETSDSGPGSDSSRPDDSLDGPSQSSQMDAFGKGIFE